MSEVWLVFFTQTPLSYVLEAHRERANTALGPGRRSIAMGDRDGPGCSQTALNKEIHPQGGLVGERM